MATLTTAEARREFRNFCVKLIGSEQSHSVLLKYLTVFPGIGPPCTTTGRPFDFGRQQKMNWTLLINEPKEFFKGAQWPKNMRGNVFR